MGVKAGDMTLGDEDEKGGWVGRGIVGEQWKAGREKPGDPKNPDGGLGTQRPQEAGEGRAQPLLLP